MSKDRIDIIIGKLKGKPKKEEDSSDFVQKMGEEEGDSDEGLKATADELIEAIQSGDTDGVVEALKSFMAQC